jgi:hypothetical protein
MFIHDDSSFYNTIGTLASGMKARIASHTVQAMLQRHNVAPVDALNSLGSTYGKPDILCETLTDWMVVHLQVAMISFHCWYKLKSIAIRYGRV